MHWRHLLKVVKFFNQGSVQIPWPYQYYWWHNVIWLRKLHPSTHSFNPSQLIINSSVFIMCKNCNAKTILVFASYIAVFVFWSQKTGWRCIWNITCSASFHFPHHPCIHSLVLFGGMQHHSCQKVTSKYSCHYRPLLTNTKSAIFLNCE